MSANTIYILHAVCVFLQMVNAGLATIEMNPIIPLLVAAAVGGFQTYLNHVGIQAPSPKVQSYGGQK